MVIFFASMSVVLMGCASNRSSYAMQVDELISKQERLVGQKVTVEGYLLFSTNSRNLWQSKASSETEPFDQCVSVGWSQMNLHRLLGFNGKMVRVTGTLVHRPFGEDEVNLWYCSDRYIATERVTLVTDR